VLCRSSPTVPEGETWIPSFSFKSLAMCSSPHEGDFRRPFPNQDPEVSGRSEVFPLATATMMMAEILKTLVVSRVTKLRG
jgi:hypothetical protein